MVKRTVINELIFIEQTRYYIYKSEKDLQDSKITLSCSDPKLFEANKKLARKNKKAKASNKFIVMMILISMLFMQCNGKILFYKESNAPHFKGSYGKLHPHKYPLSLAGLKKIKS